MMSPSKDMVSSGPAETMNLRMNETTKVLAVKDVRTKNVRAPDTRKTVHRRYDQ